jgi:hypothetical protein
MQTPKLQEISFVSDSSDLVPKRAWSDLSGLFAGAGASSGLIVIQNRNNPDYPGEYIQYPELSWCQPTFPASGTRYALIPGKPLILRYRLLVHTGTKPNNDISSKLWDTYNSETEQQLIFSIPKKEPEN